MATVKRNLLIDAAKGLGILLVVFGHTIQKNYPDFDNIIFRVIYSFHMPLFMFLSGCVAKYGDYRSITKNITRLVVPFIAWYVIAAFVQWHATGQRPNFPAHMLTLIKSPDWGLWFLWVLFLCHVCFYAMWQAQKYGGILAAGLIFILVQFIPIHILGVDLLKWHFVFFVAGYMVMHYQDYFIRWRYGLMLFAALAYCILFPYWQFISDDLFLNAIAGFVQVGEHTGKHLAKIFHYTTAFAGIGVVISLVYFAMKWRPVGIFLATIGLYTLDIYVSHQLLLGYAFGQIMALKILTAFVNALVLSLALGYILKKIPVVKTILYGVVPKKISYNALPAGAPE